MFQFPDAESGKEEGFGAGEAAGGGEVGDAVGGLGAGATAASFGFASGGRFAHGKVSTIHDFHN